MPIYTVKQGECLSVIGENHGFFWETLWNLDENRELRELRVNPNILLPGDKVFIPNLRPKDEPGETTLTHTFRLKGVPVKLVFRLIDADGVPRAGLPYTLEVDGKSEKGTVPDAGTIEHLIPPKAKKAKLTVQDPEGDETYNFDLGYLKPSDNVAGVKARLANLGFYNGSIDEQIDDATKGALQMFQAFAGLPQTGELDDAMKNALRDRHDL